MKNSFIWLFTIVLAVISVGCGKKGSDHSGHDMKEADARNQVLYNEIRDIHDEVMPRTEEIYNISKQLKQNLKDATTDAERDLLQTQINYFDSVNRMMMDWMHEFKPLPDTTNEETAREYYETHLEKVKKVKEAILTAVEKGNN